MSGKIVKFSALTLIAALLASCGVRGPLEPPPGHHKDKKDNTKFFLDDLV